MPRGYRIKIYCNGRYNKLLFPWHLIIVMCIGSRQLVIFSYHIDLFDNRFKSTNKTTERSLSARRKSDWGFKSSFNWALVIWALCRHNTRHRKMMIVLTLRTDLWEGAFVCPLTAPRVLLRQTDNVSSSGRTLYFVFCFTSTVWSTTARAPYVWSLRL